MPAVWRALRGAIYLAIVWAALAVGVGKAQAAPGYWRFDHIQGAPTQEYLNTIKAGPGHIHEQKVTYAFQNDYAGKGAITLYFKNDDADHRVYVSSYTYNFGTSTDMSVLVPGQVVKFKGDVTFDSTFPSATANGKMAVDNGDYFLAFDGQRGGAASSEGEFKTPGGGPGATMDLYANAYLAANGAFSARLDVIYKWVEGTPPAHVDTGAAPPDHHPANQTGGVEDPVADVTWYVCSYPNPSETCGDWLFHSDGTIQGIVNGQLVWSGHWSKLGRYAYEYDFFYSGVTLHTWVRFSDPSGVGRATELTGYPDASMTTIYRKGQRK
jgi:hypothetical protein